MCIRDYLQSHRVWFETLLHPPVPSASRVAQRLHVSGRSVAKSVLVKCGQRFVLAVLPATSRIDWERLAEVVPGEPLSLASEDDAERVFGDCERGALPPFGRLYGLTTIVDASLAGGPEIIFVANCRHEGMRMRYRDFETVEAPIRARFAIPTAPRQRRPSSRRAG
jgi:Ala-tRNA(Pro) deacylase